MAADLSYSAPWFYIQSPLLLHKDTALELLESVALTTGVNTVS
jgi:hypothetical protein